MKGFQMTEKHELAAVLLSLGTIPHEEVAERVGVSRATLFRWKAEPVFTRRMWENAREVRKRVLEASIADVMSRVHRLDRRWQDIDAIIAARAADPAMESVPGGKTGLMMLERKRVGSGEQSEVVESYKFDAALVREERELARQASNELGHWGEKYKAPEHLDFDKWTDEDIKQFVTLHDKAATADQKLAS